MTRFSRSERRNSIISAMILGSVSASERMAPVQWVHPSERIPIVPLYLARERPVVNRGGQWIMVDDERFRLEPGEKPQPRKVRFRTLGCYPLTGAIESEADTLPKVIQETLLARTSERNGRVIDHDAAASMEKKKREGYF